MKNEVIKKIKKELNKFLGSNRINSTMLNNPLFKHEYDFNVSGRTIYRFMYLKKNIGKRTQIAIMDRLGIKYEDNFKGLKLIEDEK